MEATETAGFRVTGEFQQLNSYENRVFDIALEDSSQERIIAKFYRPGRWSPEALQEEHSFLFELQDAEVPVVPPLILPRINSSLLLFQGIWVSFFPKIRGRMPDEWLPRDLQTLGHHLAQLHQLGLQKNFRFRPEFGSNPIPFDQILDKLLPMVAPEVRGRYQDAAEVISDRLSWMQEEVPFQRIHGDLHRGNVLDTKGQLLIVDFDDCQMGPRIYDLWMIYAHLQTPEEKETLLNAYDDILDFPHDQLQLIPLMQAYRLITYSYWIHARWQDPSFPRIFPEFGTYSYWAEETDALEAILRL